VVTEVEGDSLAFPGTALSRAGGITDRVGAVLGNPVFRLAARRLALAPPLLFVVSALSFALLSLTPGDAAQAILGTTGTPEQYANLRRQLGLDLPVYEQYWRWLTHAVRGDLGSSLVGSGPVAHLVTQRLPASASLIVGSLLAILVVGVSLGIFSAVRGGIAGRVVDAVALLGFALPGFWFGAILIELFAVRLRLFPAIGYVPLGQSTSGWLRSLVLPVTALALGGIGPVAKYTREAMLDVLASEHIRMARANGLPVRTLLFRYALRVASIRIITVLGLIAVGLLGGTILIENVFAIPGLGSLVGSAVLRHDLPVVQGIAVCFTVIVVFVNLVVDIAYGLLDPRLDVR
jgi:peptide/nickel transport system permease protein